MTDKELILFIRENKKFPIAKWILVLKSIGLVFISIFLLSISGIFTSVLIKSKISQGTWTILLLIIPAVYVGTSILLNLKNEWISKSKFKEIFTHFSAEENLVKMTELLKTNFRVKHINVDKNNKVIYLFTKISWRSWGDKITVLCDNNRVLLNSQKTSGQIYSDGQQRANINKIISLMVDFRATNQKNKALTTPERP